MDKKEASGMKMYKVFYSFTLSPDKHFGVTRDKCKCGICPDESIIKSGTEIYSHGDENEVDDEEHIIDSLESAENYLDAKYQADKADAVARLDIYLNNSVGIGEHPQHTEEMDTIVAQYADAEDKRQSLNAMIANIFSRIEMDRIFVEDRRRTLVFHKGDT